jgi:glycerol uptake facilitator-like aquaporin
LQKTHDNLMGISPMKQPISEATGAFALVFAGTGAIFGGPISGASLNPAHSLGPVIFASQLAVLWLYVTAPVVGSLLAVQACKLVREPGCCDSRAS